jgi:hypothetical protein
MAVNKPIGDNTRKGVGQEAHPAEKQAHWHVDQAQQEGRPVHGCQKDGEEVQRRPPREGLISAKCSPVTVCTDRKELALFWKVLSLGAERLNGYSEAQLPLRISHRGFACPIVLLASA